MVTISLFMVVKAVALVILCFLSALFVLFPINDRPTSGTQWIVFFVVCAFWFDLLFTHNLSSHIQFVP